MILVPMTLLWNRRQMLAALSAPLLEVAPKPRELFNGRDLSGWTAHAHGKWTVENGLIVGRSDHARPGPGFLLTNEEFGDFRLELDFWVSRQGNSGVYVRQPIRVFSITDGQRPGQQPIDGHEIQIDYNDPRNYTGAVYNFRKPDRVVGGEERWNHYAIECVGQRVQVWIDGEQVNDYAPLRSAKGAVGFQIHGQKPHDHVIQFRAVQLTALR